jgi:DNA repair protein RadC
MRIIIREAGVEYKTATSMTVRTPHEASNAVKEIKDSDTECFAVLYLNSKNGLIEADIISSGVIDACLVHPREVFRTAISKNAKAVILAHNHPSGDPSPSSEDIRLTRQIVEAGKVIDIPVVDSIIVGKDNDNPCSLREEGLVTFGV